MVVSRLNCVEYTSSNKLIINSYRAGMAAGSARSILMPLNP